uniref:Inositol polyphosphate-related phosphatase domain-containing protein n=1 Tax=Lotharella oceanica TaxID=641309 RepID=A0A7S2TQ38_9EUKA|mmetsp:Transcript_22690/g.42603  ORF Transcript_22690/g.42603 Transcript_22690/m.42603 type:complete len:140 (+) Transcript_22690:170-589(+)
MLNKHGEVDVTIFLGDLNYRVDITDVDQVLSLMKEGDYKMMLEKDQLKKQMSLLPAFKTLEESPITFQPTYKLTPMTNVYDPAGAKKRIPAWCDRILYSAKNKKHLSTLFYTAAALASSDHKPVSALHEVWIGDEEEDV